MMQLRRIPTYCDSSAVCYSISQQLKWPILLYVVCAAARRAAPREANKAIASQSTGRKWGNGNGGMGEPYGLLLLRFGECAFCMVNNK